MTKIKLKILLPVLILLAVLVVAGILLWRFLPREEKAEDFVATDKILPVPDRITASYGNREGALSAADAEAVHTALLQAMQTATRIEVKDGVHLSSLWEGDQRLIFEYDGTYRYETGFLCTVPFDRAVVEVYDGIVFVCYGAGEDACTVIVELPQDNAFFTLANTVIGRSIENPVGIPTHTVNTAVVDTPTFAARPDAIVVKGKNGSVQLTAEQADAAYAAFEQMNAARDGYIKGPDEVIKSLYTVRDAYEAIDEGTCIEFRYHQRQRYSGVLFQYDPNPEKGRTEPALIEETVTYDSVLFFLGGGGKILGSLDGLYFCLTGPAPNGHFDLGPGYDAFCDAIWALLPGEEGAS